MGYFTNKAAQTFRTTSGGERLFRPDGPMSPVYVIPDPATEQMLLTKEAWKHRLFVGGFLLVVFLPHLVCDDMACDAFLLVWFFCGSQMIGHVLFARDLRGLKRLEKYSYASLYNDSSAQPPSRRELLWGFFGSLLFVLGGVSLICDGRLVDGIIMVIIFGLCALACGIFLQFDR